MEGSANTGLRPPPGAESEGVPCQRTDASRSDCCLSLGPSLPGPAPPAPLGDTPSDGDCSGAVAQACAVHDQRPHRPQVRHLLHLTGEDTLPEPPAEHEDLGLLQLQPKSSDHSQQVRVPPDTQANTIPDIDSHSRCIKDQNARNKIFLPFGVAGKENINRFEHAKLQD